MENKAHFVPLICLCKVQYRYTVFYQLQLRLLFQIEIDAVTNQDFYIEIVCKVLIYGFQPCTTWWLSEGNDYLRAATTWATAIIW